MTCWQGHKGRHCPGRPKDQGAAREVWTRQEYFCASESSHPPRAWRWRELEKRIAIPCAKAPGQKAGLPKEARQEAEQTPPRLATMHADSAEAGVARTYLEWMAELPGKNIRDGLDASGSRRFWTRIIAAWTRSGSHSRIPGRAQAQSTQSGGQHTLLRGALQEEWARLLSA